MSKNRSVVDEPAVTEQEKAVERTNKLTELQVADTVMDVLGKPDDFISCVAKRITNTWYRVNVRCKNKLQNTNLLTVSEIRHSYFIQCVGGDLKDGDKVENLYPVAS
jgi:hypothetical protein